MLKDLGTYVNEADTIESADFWVSRLRSGRVYIAGPMKGIPDLNYPKFMKMTAAGRGCHWDIQNPAGLGSKRGVLDEDFSLASRHPQVQGMVIISGLSLLATCSTMVLLDGWEESNGSLIELMLANRIGIKAISERAYMNCIEYSRFGELIKPLAPA
jgi:hypothetical protein